jgi:5'-nucleotidase
VPPVYDALGCDGLSGEIVPILGKLDPAIRVVVSGHTHHAYACEVEAGGAPRLLTSAGKNGYLVSDIRLSFDPATRRLVEAKAQNVPVLAERDPEVQALVDRYVAAARPAAERVVGRLSRPALKDADDGDSAAGELIADAQLAATRAPDKGGAEIAFINSGGVRTDLVPRADGSVTFGQIFATQPFGNNLVVKTLTGAQLKALLEQGFREVNGKVRDQVAADPVGGLHLSLRPQPAGRAADRGDDAERSSDRSGAGVSGDGQQLPRQRRRWLHGAGQGRDARRRARPRCAGSLAATNPRVPDGKRISGN